MKLFLAVSPSPDVYPITQTRRLPALFLNLLLLSWFGFTLGSFPTTGAEPQPGSLIKLAVPAAYLPPVPVLVRVEVIDPATGRPSRDLWDVEAVLSTTPPSV